MSKFAIPNVDIQKLTNSDQQFQYLLNIVQELQQRRTENAKLKAEITNLHAQLNSTPSQIITKNASDSSSVFPPVVTAAKQTSAAPIPSYSAVAARSVSKPVNKKRKLAAGRTFMPVDPSAPRGFEYLYLNRKRKLTRAEVRRNLRLLGLDLSRVLDICFPGPKVIGLLVHVQYKEEVISLLSTAKVPLVDGFDPLDPVNLADPELQHLSLADKANECAELQFTRCSRALSRLGAGRAHLVGPVGKYFSSKGWIDEDSLSQILSSLPSPLSASRGRDPGAAFRGDTVMSDALVSDSASAGSHSL
ncbi:hypothetical protein G6F57_015358 [Rhizopus arrhizus]|nr:hypothetical protein G6F30_012940 [Rhizopus arrhizus]KAG0973398.1 hypothetical protein G6F29_012863 [Rhizopus arrhizus]KAG0975057.1 hypothetical protein G6F28_013035 [Rhizopus arrhizus]KAG1001227.1 hypothetical protein G6F27_013072 [Rhizopus arrhizus]KAG1015777.1 hypothetical protein G6F26_013024 [Rhizopus arrhizus]